MSALLTSYAVFDSGIFFMVMNESHYRVEAASSIAAFSFISLQVNLPKKDSYKQYL